MEARKLSRKRTGIGTICNIFFRIKANRIVQKPEGLPPKRQAADCKADGNASVRYLERNQKSKEKKEEEGEESYRGSRPEWCS